LRRCGRASSAGSDVLAPRLPTLGAVELFAGGADAPATGSGSPRAERPSAKAIPNTARAIAAPISRERGRVAELN
jgi:hypothetical protein